MGLIRWAPHYSVNVSEMDEHHKKLIMLINTLYDAMRAGKGSEVIGPLLAELVAYTIYHFRAEEQLLQEHAYPELEQQQTYHREMANKALQMKAAFDQGSGIPSLDVMLFLSNWLNYHILDEDKKYGPHLNSRGIF